MPHDTPTPDGSIGRLVDEQLELASARLPPLAPAHPSPLDHEERRTAHPDAGDVLLGKAPASEEMLDEMAALQSAPPLSDEELARQALADGGADGDPSTPE
jgi:hypothetical protein